MPRRYVFLMAVCLPLLPTFPSTPNAGPVATDQARPVDQYGDLLPEGAVARMGSVRFHHQGGVIAAAFSPDGKTLVAAGFGDGVAAGVGNGNGGLSLRFWETDTGKEVGRLDLQEFELNGLTFAPDGKTIYVGSP